MVFDAFQDQAGAEDEQKKNQPNSGSVELSGGGGGLVGGNGVSPQGQPAGAGNNPTSSGSWTNLNSYLSANKDQAPALGQGIADSVGKQAEQSTQDLGTAVSGFKNQQPFQSVNNTTTEQVDQAFANPSQYGNGQDVTTPEKYLNNDWGINSQNTDLTKYNPNEGPSWAGVNSSFKTASDNLQNTQTEAGRGTLLQNQFGSKGNQYNQGEQNFDQLLLQQNPENQTALNSVYNQYAPSILASKGVNGTPKALSDALTDSQGYAKGIQDRAKGFQAQATTDLGNQIGTLQNRTNEETSTKNAANSAAYSSILQALQNNDLSSDQISDLNANGGSGLSLGQHTYDLSPASYLTAGPSYTNSTAATDQDLNNFRGLNALLSGYHPTGSDAPAAGTFQASLSNIFGTNGAPTAATAAIDPYSFNGTSFNSDRSMASSNYNNAIQAANATVAQTAPMSGDFLGSLDSRSPQENLAQIQKELAFWRSQNGNPYQSKRVQQARAAVEALQRLIDQYHPDSSLGINSEVWNSR